MAADYSIKLPCSVRQKMPQEVLFELVKIRVTAQHLIAQTLELYPNQDPYDCDVELSVTRPNGEKKTARATVREMLAATEELESLSSSCQGCRANVNDRSFGCIGKINYPIEKASEAWLVSRLPEDSNSPTLALLFDYLSENNIDAAPVRNMRAQTNIFQSRTPIERSWGGWLRKRNISSDQIIHMLLFVGDASSKNAKLISKLLRLPDVLSESHPKSDNIEQFKSFFCALVMAGRLDSSVEIDS